MLPLSAAISAALRASACRGLHTNHVQCSADMRGAGSGEPSFSLATERAAVLCCLQVSEMQREHLLWGLAHIGLHNCGVNCHKNDGLD